uniref:Transmembrane protein 230 n=1 Tax=Eutreptiella gymnastica TaxID=73025 RepID=A0A7S1HZY3_9EUGL|mmetsp:Transcript_117665/g.204863  ORF Transcript_117665/g.204863 Transcript_117665/m.204863 type:complete len:148 (+) Transcript_117665:70-513(+)
MYRPVDDPEAIAEADPWPATAAEWPPKQAAGAEKSAGATQAPPDAVVETDRDANPPPGPTGFRDTEEWERVLEIPLKMLLMAAALLIGGLVLLLLGIGCLVSSCAHWVGLVVVGSLMTIPGAYAAFVLVQFIRNKGGYHWNQLPQMD